MRLRFRRPASSVRFETHEPLGNLRELAPAVRERFGFLESELGFDPPRTREHDGELEVTWKHRAAGLAVSVFVTRVGVDSGWIGRLDSAGRLRPLDPDTIDRDWWDLRDLGLEPPRAGSVSERIEEYARTLHASTHRVLEPGVPIDG